MGYIEDISFDQPKLCMFYLGGRFEGCSIEMHDVMFLVGKASADIFPKLRRRWRGTAESLHVDSWYPVENVDGYDIELRSDPPQDAAKHLHFVNLGAYRKGAFGELHHMELVVATNVDEAKAIAKSRAPKGWDQLHTDDLVEVDDCIRLDKVDDRFIDLVEGGRRRSPPSTNGWLRLPKLAD